MMLLPRPFVSQSMCMSLSVCACVYVNARMMPIKWQVPELQNIRFFLFAISGCNRCAGSGMPVSNMNIVPLVSQLSLCDCLIAVSSLCAFMRTMYFTCYKMPPLIPMKNFFVVAMPLSSSVHRVLAWGNSCVAVWSTAGFVSSSKCWALS